MSHHIETPQPAQRPRKAAQKPAKLSPKKRALAKHKPRHQMANARLALAIEQGPLDLNNYSETAIAFARQRLDNAGIELLANAIADGQTMTALAKAVGVSIGSLFTWVNAIPERLARIDEARILAARVWDEKAESGLLESDTMFKLTRARDLAHHYRWRATKIAPLIYGERIAAEISESPALTEDRRIARDEMLKLLERLAKPSPIIDQDRAIDAEMDGQPAEKPAPGRALRSR